ncbi:diguanylate cyclase [Bordetella holmesii]|nr:diguanylate cyclase [Bordetella holmesii H558]AOB36127.1 diguanylate cyclase [Bordetella holmesii]EXF90217.1 diguanylate cyclase domain protein [Bordetella holmesii 30539]KAK81557.1 diguanylate cyclase (GGDEF) domain protein [Bordetella holmesii CDC-H809-BH]KAK82589.1 diguanylate cyclase (GGDEF) domain protein [Bordetella holmesii CDC-H572-BH]KAK82688.1 diguanylate cyclase (GGDEF) domain protein [Bordetella holmesii H620]KAK89697.1 diguanylate cyclase (GGDEF) domain protein [Bordetella hol
MLYLIVALAMLSSAVAFATALGLAYAVQREHLMAQALSANQAYAAKFAEAIDIYVGSVQRQLRSSARRLPALMQQPDALQAEASRLAELADGESVAAIADKDDKVIAYATLTPDAASNPGTLAGLEIGDRQSRDNVSAVYLTAAEKMAVALTEPIRGPAGEYLGLVGLSTLVHKDNQLSRLVGNHSRADGFYAYVVDGTGTIIAHQDPRRVGSSERHNEAVESLLRKERGARAIVNTRGELYLAGYAPVATADWGVVVQSPQTIITTPQRTLLARAALYSLPIALIIFFAVCALAYGIARPLGKLANILRSTDLAHPQPASHISSNWYFEAQQLGEAVDITLAEYRQRLSSLDAETLADPMTGLLNRRGLAREMGRLQANRQPFAALALDLDHFKRVNDTFGHAAGDEVLKALANLTRTTIRQQDCAFRVGGEEYLVLMPGADMPRAQALAERLRAAVQATHMPGGVGHVTVSIGVALWQAHGDAQVVLAHADQALYEAKRKGRNRVTAHTGGKAF